MRGQKRGERLKEVVAIPYPREPTCTGGCVWVDKVGLKFGLE